MMVLRPSLLAALAALTPWLAAAEPAGPAPEAAVALAADDATLAALALALATAPAPEDLDAARRAEAPAVELVISLRAARLVFDEVPRLRVAYGGGRRATWRAERTRLPARVRAGEVYEDVEVRVTVAGPLEEVASMIEDARATGAGIRIQNGTVGAAGTPGPEARP